MNEPQRPGGSVQRDDFIEFVRHRGLAVVATCSAGGLPQAALVGITATSRAELVFDTSASSRKCRNLQTTPRVAVVIGWDDEVTIQCEGVADIPSGEDRARCVDAYLAQYPDGMERARDPEIVHVRVRLTWLRYCDYRPDTFGLLEIADPF